MQIKIKIHNIDSSNQLLTHLTRGENEKENGDPLTKERALLA